MSDIYTRDPNRIVLSSPVGDIQAWGASASATSVVMSLYANVEHASTKTAYVSQSLNMSATDARQLAAVLIKAADHANKVCTDEPAEAAAIHPPKPWLNGEPYYCADCGAGGPEVMGCERPCCRMETRETAQARQPAAKAESCDP